MSARLFGLDLTSISNGTKNKKKKFLSTYKALYQALRTINDGHTII